MTASMLHVLQRPPLCVITPLANLGRTRRAGGRERAVRAARRPQLRRKRGERGAQPAEGGTGSGRGRRRGSSSGAARTTATGQTAATRRREQRATDGLLARARGQHTHSSGARRTRVSLRGAPQDSKHTSQQARIRARDDSRYESARAHITATPRHLTTGQQTHFRAHASQSPQ